MHRSTSRCMAFLVSATCYGQGSVVSSTVDNWSLSPSVRVQLASGWDVRLSGTYSESDTSVRTSFFARGRSEEHTSELQSQMRISYAVFCWKNKITTQYTTKKNKIE